jgi:predicted nucleic acid-binding Zn ribbon protein
MPRICSHCHKLFEHDGKYCSEHCSREVRRRRLHILPAIVVGVLVILFAIYTTPGNDLRPEPSQRVSISELQKLAKDDLCPICAGKGKVDCKICIDGKIFYMGTSMECHRCGGKGWLTCPVCKGTGKLRDALDMAAP